jgi:hypothetical protein
MRRLVTAFALSCTLGSPLHAQRHVTQAIRSDTLPRITVEVAPGLTYLGQVGLDVGGRARAEQHLFGEVRAGRLRRAVIVHFEHFLPDNTHVFEYPRLRMTRLGRHEYLHQTWPLPDWELFRRPEMTTFLAQRGVTAGTAWIVSRYVRVVSDDRKHEFILFYLEDGEALGVPIAELRPEGRLRHRWAEIEHGLVNRAAQAFRVID